MKAMRARHGVPFRLIILSKPPNSFPEHNLMGQNLKTRQKRRRRKLYLKRKSDRLKAGAANKPAKEEKPAKKAAKKPAKKAAKKVAKKAVKKVAKKAAVSKADESGADTPKVDPPKDETSDKE